ncbi:hybrid sensor histidine kinase/response regulator [Novosphingobium sp. SL115]|uniref:ATP-binding response regulator n=1 Tax=Novosphingobium sp. SL115 TaxID=2995150 RepID=UPI0022726DAB|nr:hybrid sensor histidine kinase/response regulator [Novosphingobium sp. SL115]MCY1672606.1 hybrid sensor histidine kinase/response regulator [Novosphingobium sp. SL115]
MVSAPDTQDGDTQQRILIEQIRIVYSMLARSGSMTLVLSAFVTLVLREHGMAIWAWFGLQATLKIAELAELRWFYDPAMVAVAPDRMLRRLCITQALHAAGWASLLAIAGQNISAPEFVFVVMALGGVLSGGVTTYGALPKVHAVYIASFIAVSFLTMLYLVTVVPDNPAFYLMPVLAMLYCIGTYMNTRVSGEAYYRHIALGFANAELAEGLARQAERAEAARQTAEAADRAKSTFLASASHDLRQPIHATGLFLALLKGSKLEPAQREMVMNASSALHASSEMLDALLDFSRADAGVIEPKARTFFFDDLVRQLETELGVQADDKRIAFRVHECGHHVHADPGLVRLILLNLISNAIRYTDNGGLLIGARRREQVMIAEVWDTGIGIPVDQQETIFGDFTQLGNPERDRRKGLGLGLAIARRMARLIGTDITVSSEPGHGSVFRFSLPLAPSVRTEQPPVLVPQTERPGTAKGARVILLDDDVTILHGLGALLAAQGHDVATAETIEEALEHAANQVPDLLVSDFRLRRGRDGTDAVRLMRQKHGAGLPVLMITGDTHPDRIAAAEREDMKILYKPVDPDRIVEAVASLVK